MTEGLVININFYIMRIQKLAQFRISTLVGMYKIQYTMLIE